MTTKTEEIVIPKIYAEKMEKLSKKWGISQNEISQHLLDKYCAERDDMKSKNIPLPKEADLWKRAWTITVGEMSRDFGSSKSNAPTFYIYKIGDSGVFDAIERYHKPHSIKVGSVNDENTPLDYRDKLFGKPNPNVGNPYDPNKPEWMREVFALVSDNENFERPTLYVIQGSGDGAFVPMDAPMHQFYKTRLNLVKAKLTNPTLRLSRATRWNVVENPPYTVSELMGKVEYFDLDEAITQIAPTHSDKPSKQPYSIVRGVVSIVGREREDKDSRYITIVDDVDNSMLIALPKSMKFNYRSGSEMYFVGRFGKMKGKEGYIMNAVGFIPGDVLVEQPADETKNEQLEKDLQREDETATDEPEDMSALVPES